MTGLAVKTRDSRNVNVTTPRMTITAPASRLTSRNSPHGRLTFALGPLDVSPAGSALAVVAWLAMRLLLATSVTSTSPTNGPLIRSAPSDLAQELATPSDAAYLEVGRNHEI